jgi:hypothetical protein
MSDSIQIVKQLTKAFETKNAPAFRALLHSNYTFHGPCMKFGSPDEAAEFLKQCPFKARSENTHYIASGNEVVQTFDWVISEPFEATIRMAEHLTLKDDKILRAELFYDTSKMPSEAMEGMKAQA